MLTRFTAPRVPKNRLGSDRVRATSSNLDLRWAQAFLESGYYALPGSGMSYRLWPLLGAAERAMMLILALSTPNLFAQSPPPAAALSSLVDKFTGDLSYSLPLMVVPGPNGESFPITLQYQGGGTGVDQAASEIGLGWSIPIGEIARNVNGHPDDLKAGVYERTKLAAFPADEEQVDAMRVYGPVHFKDIPAISDPTMSPTCTTCVAMDLYESRSGFAGTMTTFEFPDYDDYTAIGPALSAELNMHLFDYSSIFQKPRISDPDGDEVHFTHDFSSETYRRTERRPTLLINEARQLNIEAGVNRAYRSWAADSPSLSDIFPTAPAMASWSFSDDLIRSEAGSLAKSGYFVQYFTNTEIYAHYNGSSADSIPGFIDWQLANQYPARNNGTHFEPDGIGAIQVVDPSGFAYHYSLPVYTNSEKRFVFDLAYDESEGYLLPSPPYGCSAERIESNYRYASTWKLVAITGPDYNDANGNNRPDGEDAGYWIAFDYAKWASSFPLRFPVFGYQQDLSGKKPGDQYMGALDYGTTPYRMSGSSVRMDHEVYYLNAIVTSTHSAFFIHDVRFDEHSIEAAPKPKLKLSEIILVRNEDIPAGAFLSSTLPDDGPFASHSTTGVGAGNVFNTAQVDESDLRDVSLASVLFEQDYSLARKLHNNIHSATAGDLFDNPYEYGNEDDEVYYDGPSSIDPSDLSKSGKLTLKGLRMLNNEAEQVTPGYDFTYFNELEIEEETDPLYFEPKRKDHFGHFKYDFDPVADGAYTTSRSAQYLHAWSLATINDPMGATISMEYEPDQYELVGYGNQLPVPPSRHYFLKNIPSVAATDNEVTVTLFDADGAFELNSTSANPSILDVSLYYFVSCSTGQSRFTRSFQDLVGQSASGNSVVLQRTEGEFASGFNCWPETPVFQNQSTDFVAIRYNRQYGGGTRIRELTLKGPATAQSYTLRLNYTQGICTAEPDPFDADVPHVLRNGDLSGQIRDVTMDRAAGDRHAPPAQVGYSLVTEEVIDPNGLVAGGIEHEFINFIEPYKWRHTRARTSTWLNVFDAVECMVDGSLYGKPASAAVFDKHGARLSQTIYRYAFDPTSSIEEAFSRIGTSSQFIPFFFEGIVLNSNPELSALFVKKTRRRSLSAIEHHENGKVLTTTFGDIDHNTGEPLQTTLTQETVGTRTTTKELAYTEYDDLGPKWADSDNRNILTPTSSSSSSTGAASKSDWAEAHAIRRYDPSEQEYVTEVLTTQWAPTRSYTKKGSASTDWQYLGRPTLYSERMQPLEQKDMKDGYSATRLTLSGEQVLSQVGNCNHASSTFCTFEKRVDLGTANDPQPWFDGEVCAIGLTGVVLTTNSNIAPHSGAHSVTVPSGSAGPFYRAAPGTRTDDGELVETGLLRGRTYRAVAWVHTSSPNTARLKANLTGSYTVEASMARNDAAALTVGDWIRLEVRIAVPGDFTTSAPGQGLTVRLDNSAGGSAAYFDDLILYPIDASFSGALWDERRGLLKTAIDQEGFLTEYAHDAAGTVTEVRQETENGKHLAQKSEVVFKKPF